METLAKPLANAPDAMLAKQMAKTLAVAPMIDWTDRHCRAFHRRIAPRVRLYTEMIVADAVLHGKRERLLGYDQAEHPVALQLGGCDPHKLAAAARIGADYGYDEINLNCGCPSDRVRDGAFGACLMQRPAVVAEGVAAMIAAVPAHIPVTVKCRLGIDERDDWEFLEAFLTAVHAAGCRHFIVHARQAILGGLSPKENREIPPLRHAEVWRVKRAFPDCQIVINGGLQTVADVAEHLAHVDGAMLGREAYHRPYVLAELEQAFWGAGPAPTEEAMADWLAEYTARHVANGGRVHDVARHALGLFTGKPGARAWRRYLSEHSNRRDVTPSVFANAARVARQLLAQDEIALRQ